MSASQEQKVDYLLKKIGYVSSKTGIAEDSSLSGTKKAPFAEPISSPLVVPSSFVWSDSSFIPTTPPGSTGTYVEVYATASAYQMTVDTTVSGNRTFIARATAGDSSSAIEGDWIDPSFGSSYVIKVYKGDPNSGGALLPAAGSGSNDTWFFDYSSGVLNFNGTSVPSGVTSTNIYLVGYRYIGAKGIQPPAGIATFNDLHVSGITTLGTVQITSSFSGGIVTALSGVVTYYGDGSNLTGISTDSDKLQGQNGSYYLDYNNFTSTPTIPTVNDATLTLATSGDGISGSDTFTANQASNTTFTVIVSSASTNQANTLVYRDASGGFSAGVVTATSFSGSGANLTGIGTQNNLGSFDNLVVAGIATFNDDVRILGGGLDVVGVSTFKDNLHLLDSGKLLLGGSAGTHDGLEVYHNGSHSYISDQGTGDLRLLAGDFRVRNAADDETMIQANVDGDVSLWYNNSKKLATNNTGIDVTGVITTDGMTTSADINFGDNDKAIFGAGSDLQIYHDGSNSYIKDTGTGNLLITSDGASVQINKGTTENMAEFITDGAVKLYYDSVKKFETTSAGVSVTGSLSVSTTSSLVGDVSVGDTNSAFIGMLRAGANYIAATNAAGTLIFRTGGTTPAITIDANQNIKFDDYGSGNNTGTETYNLAVDTNGNVIETPATNPGGKSGTFYKEYTTGTVAAGAATAFTLTRATSGTLVFTVYLTATLATDKQVAKMYQVAHTYGQTPVYNKVIDTGPLGADITVAFADSSNTAVTCSIAAVTEDSQPVGITVVVGHGATAVTFA